MMQAGRAMHEDETRCQIVKRDMESFDLSHKDDQDTKVLLNVAHIRLFNITLSKYTL